MTRTRGLFPPLNFLQFSVALSMTFEAKYARARRVLVSRGDPRGKTIG